jgi:trans-aconitate methyltransferase
MAQQRFPEIDFWAADVRELRLSQRYDVIVCNGLIGGPMLYRDAELARFSKRLRELLAPGGIISIADRFHGGHRQARTRFLAEFANNLKIWVN